MEILINILERKNIRILLVTLIFLLIKESTSETFGNNRLLTIFCYFITELVIVD